VHLPCGRVMTQPFEAICHKETLTVPEWIQCQTMNSKDEDVDTTEIFGGTGGNRGKVW
jgi:hypothetical protein